MRKPVGVIIAGVLLGVFALFGILGELLSLGIFIFSHSPVIPKIPGVRAMMISFTALELAFFIFCAWTVVGLFRLRPWARVAAIVIAGLNAFFAAATGFGVLMARHYAAMLPPGPASANVDTVLVGVAVFGFLMALISIWWIVYFCLSSVRRAFAGTPALTAAAGAYGTTEIVAAQPKPPISGWRVVIIVWACLLLFSVVSLPMVLWMGTPMFFFGAILSGWAVRAFLLVTWAIEIYMAIGLLRKWKAAWYVALLFQVYAIGYSAEFLLPGVRARFGGYMQDVMARSSAGLVGPNPFMSTRIIGWSMGFGLIVVFVLIWALIARRQDYLHA